MRLFEFEDLSWFPDVVRSGMTDQLSFMIRLLKVYQPITPLLLEVMDKTGENQVVDLGSGGGGPILQIQQNLTQTSKVKFILTDKFPNPGAWQYLNSKTNGQINFYAEPVSAENVPANLSGVRTLFSAAHHFKPAQLKAILQAAAGQQKAVCLFDGGDKSLLLLLASLVFQPLVFFVCTPIFKPFRWSRLLFTYVIPVIPFCAIWDGCVSLLRLYRPKELLQLAKSIQTINYTWKAGRVKNKLGLHVTYLVGYPSLG